MNSFILWNIEPNVFSDFEYLRWYGLFWLFGFLLGNRILRLIYRAEGTPETELEKLSLYVMIGAIIGARLGHIFFYDFTHYWNNPIEVLPFRLYPTFELTGFAGLASHGGILGGLIALYLYNRKFKKGYLWLLDRLTIAGAALGGLIRIGNLMNSEIIGIPTNVPWAFIFTRIDQIPRHPAQLYEALFYLLLCLILYSVWKTGRFYKNIGSLFGLGIFLIFVQRFFIEFLKENQVAFEESLFLNMGQILSIPLALAGLFFLVRGLKKFKL